MAYSTEDKEIMLKLLESTDYNKLEAVNQFRKITKKNISKSTLYEWLNNDPVFVDEMTLQLNKQLDEAEYSHKLLREGIAIRDDQGKLIAWQEKPDRAAIEFFLKSKGKSRGYTDVQKIETEGTMQLNITPLEFFKTADKD